MTYLLVNVNSIVLPIEIVAGVPLFGFLAFEVLVGFRALQVRTCLALYLLFTACAYFIASCILLAISYPMHMYKGDDQSPINQVSAHET